jgi:hypothetical protein
MKTMMVTMRMVGIRATTRLMSQVCIQPPPFLKSVRKRVTGQDSTTEIEKCQHISEGRVSTSIVMSNSAFARLARGPK